MTRIVLRPRIRMPLLVIYVPSTVLGFILLTLGLATAAQGWWLIVLGCMVIIICAEGIWRTLRVGVVIDTDGVWVRGLDSDRMTPWSRVESVECEQIYVRAGQAFYAPVIRIRRADALPLGELGSHSRTNAERHVDRLRAFTSRRS
jgi:hypothetical protein